MLHGILHRTPGAPKTLTEKVIKLIESNLTGEDNKTAVEFEKFVQEAHKTSRRLLLRIEKEMDIKTGNAEQTTDARGKAECYFYSGRA